MASPLSSPQHHSRQPSDSNPELLYKTAFCRTFTASGSCPYGVRCLFAHGQQELRTVVDNELLVNQGIGPKSPASARVLEKVRSKSMMPLATALAAARWTRQVDDAPLRQAPATSRPTTSTTSGQFFFPSSMSLTPASPLISDRTASLYMPPRLAVASSQLNSSVLAASSLASTPISSVGTPLSRKSVSDEDRSKKLYKTELCKTFEEKGSCPYGNRCQFAHGERELRAVERHRKYKTEKCKKFHADGTCPFGHRCVFIHDEDPRELPNHPLYDAEFASIRARERRSLSRAAQIVPTGSPLAGAPILSPTSRLSVSPSQTRLSTASLQSPRNAAGPPSDARAGSFLRHRLSDMKLETPNATSKASPMAGGSPAKPTYSTNSALVNNEHQVAGIFH